MMNQFPIFKSLRTFHWEPSFHTVPTAERAADDINRPHEDYPIGSQTPSPASITPTPGNSTPTAPPTNSYWPSTGWSSATPHSAAASGTSK